MVRLKLHANPSGASNFAEFQFLNGTIKAKLASRNGIEVKAFQFLNGTIKACFKTACYLTENLFQFLNGTIKARRKNSDFGVILGFFIGFIN